MPNRKGDGLVYDIIARNFKHDLNKHILFSHVIIAKSTLHSIANQSIVGNNNQDKQFRDKKEKMLHLLYLTNMFKDQIEYMILTCNHVFRGRDREGWQECYVVFI